MIFVVYLLSFIIISAVDVLGNLVLDEKQLQLIPEFLSQLLFVATTMFLVLYKTGGHPKLFQGGLIGLACGILLLSIPGLVNSTLIDVLWGPIYGIFSGVTIAYLGRKFLK